MPIYVSGPGLAGIVLEPSLHHNFKGSYQICGYSVIDVLIWQVNHAPLPSDWRMEDPQCYRAYLVLYSFDFFLDMARKPEEHVQMLESGKSQEYF